MKQPKAKFTWIAFLLILFFTSVAYAQEFDSTNSKKSYFKFSVSYQSNSVYYGRKDSLVLPYIIPAITYHNKSGFYIEGSLSYLAGTGAQVDGGSLTAGYESSSRNGKWYSDLYASKYFISSSSYSVREEVKGELGSSASYNTGPLTLDGGLDLAFSNKTDVVLNFDLSHEFEFGDNGSWAVTPTALVNAGTQNFYENYFTNRKYSQRRRRRNNQNTNTVNVIVIHKSFAVLDYELSMPVDYTTHKWGLFFTPTFSIPKNGFTYSLNNGVSYKTENLSNSFYAEAGAWVKF